MWREKGGEINLVVSVDVSACSYKLIHLRGVAHFAGGKKAMRKQLACCDCRVVSCKLAFDV